MKFSNASQNSFMCTEVRTGTDRLQPAIDLPPGQVRPQKDLPWESDTVVVPYYAVLPYSF